MDKAGVTDADLRRCVTEMQAGLIDADLGGHVVKKRIALRGRGKRGGARTIVASNHADKHELRALQELASDLLGQDANAIAAALKAEELVEICHDQ